MNMVAKSDGYGRACSPPDSVAMAVSYVSFEIYFMHMAASTGNCPASYTVEAMLVYLTSSACQMSESFHRMHVLAYFFTFAISIKKHISYSLYTLN